MLSLTCSPYIINNASADTTTYQCKHADGQMSFTDRPCGEKQQNVAKKTFRSQSDDDIQDTHKNLYKYKVDDNYQRYNYGYVKRDNPFAQQEQSKRVQQQKEWDNAGPHVVTPIPAYGYSRYTQY